MALFLINAAYLKQQDACPEQIARFEARFKSRTIKVTRSLIRREAAIFNWAWLLRHLWDTDSAQSEINGYYWGYHQALWNHFKDYDDIEEEVRNFVAAEAFLALLDCYDIANPNLTI